MSYPTRLLIRSRTALSETASLASALFREPATSTTKARDVLIRLARNHNNSVAASALRADREVGLLRYHGLHGYALLWAQGNPGGFVGKVFGGGAGTGGADPWKGLKRPMYGSRSVGGDLGGGVNLSGGEGKTIPERRARVAFMITASQRMELTSRLGYEKNEIKKLKPLEALLILENDVKPGNDETVLRLVRENEELQIAEAEKALARQRAIDEAMASALKDSAAHSLRKEKNRGDQSSDEDGKSSDGLETGMSLQNDRLLEISDGFDPSPPSTVANVDESNSIEMYPKKSAEGDSWFEVVEIDGESGKSTVVALYKTEEEAQDCVDWKMDAAHRRQQERQSDRPVSTFELRQRS